MTQVTKNGITMEYTGTGGTSSVSVSAVKNEGLDSSTTFTVSTDDEKLSHDVVVAQEGMREVFNASDGEFLLSDGTTYNVLKQGL